MLFNCMHFLQKGIGYGIMVEFILLHDFPNGLWNIFMDASQIITQGLDWDGVAALI